MCRALSCDEQILKVPSLSCDRNVLETIEKNWSAAQATLEFLSKRASLSADEIELETGLEKLIDELADLAIAVRAETYAELAVKMKLWYRDGAELHLPSGTMMRCDAIAYSVLKDLERLTG